MEWRLVRLWDMYNKYCDGLAILKPLSFDVWLAERVDC